jgi:DNA topoisomerase-6 subunit B
VKKLSESKKDKQPIALELAKKQREISVAEFFEKNRHLLGFDNKRKALLTTIKEAVDNSLDACEEARILPEINVTIIDMTPRQEKPVEVSQGQTKLVESEDKEEREEKETSKSERYRIIIEDNGPGIVKNQIPNIFARLLYGSKFHRLKMSRGQQGIGISAAALYGQLTTGKPIRIISKISPKHPAQYMELKINTSTNRPEIVAEKELEWKKEHGTKVELELEGTYQKGGQSVDRYLIHTAIVNPHVTIIYTPPDGKQMIFARATNELPKEPKEIMPHPHGVELGRLIKMLESTESRTLQSFLTNEFSRVGPDTAKEICANAALMPDFSPRKMTRELAEKLEQGIKKTKIINPSADCLSPIGAELLEKGLRKEINAEFYCATTRPPSVYRGNPFIIEAGIAYGGDQPLDEQARLLRFANRVPLLYQQGSCAISKACVTTAWRNYGLQQSKGALPIGPFTIIVSISSVWVPFTSESKEAIAHYPEILKEVKLALQEVGRKLQIHVHKKHQVKNMLERANLFERYVPEVADSLARLTGESKEIILKKLNEMIKKSDIMKEMEKIETLKGEVEEETKLERKSNEEED